MEVIDLRTNDVVAKGYEQKIVGYSETVSIFLDEAYRINLDYSVVKRLMAQFLAPHLKEFIE